jgi:hypothetical protein
MTTTALVAGPSGRVCDVAAALRAEGFATITVDDRVPVTEACNRVSPRSVDCFVQLPAEAEPEGETSLGGARPPRAHGLLSIVDAVAAVAPLLADHATVVILAEGSDPAHRRDRLLDDAVGMLAEAVVADHGSDGVRVSVLGADQSPGDIAAAARGGARPRSGPSLADFEPDLAYADWRTQVLSLSGHAEATYFGWSGTDGRRPVAIIRGAVVSPLRPVAPKPPSGSLSWGDSGPGAFLLARALLADVLGSAAECRKCGGGGGQGDCPECGGTGLSEQVEQQVTPFVHEIVAPLQGEAFELPAAVVRAWIDRRTDGQGRRARPDGKADGSGQVNPRRRRIRRRQRLNPDSVDRSPAPIHPSSVA